MWSPLFSAVGTDMPTDDTAQTINLPDSGLGQVLLVVLGFSGSDAVPSTPTGWFQPPSSGGCFWLWKIADGTEGTTLALTLAVARRGAAFAAVIDKADQESYPYISGAAANTSSSVQVLGLDQPDWQGRPALHVGAGRISSASLPSPFANYTMEGQACSTATITAWMAVRPLRITDDIATLDNAQGGSTPGWNTRGFLAVSSRPGGKIRAGMEGADFV